MGDPTKFCDSQFDASLQIIAPLKNLIVSQVAHAHPLDTRSIRAQVHQHRREASKQHALKIRSSLTPQLQRAFDLNNEPGASSCSITGPRFLFDQAGVLGCTPPALWMDTAEYS